MIEVINPNNIMAEDVSKKNNTAKTYGLDRPSKDYALNSLGRFLGEQEAAALWSKACSTCNAAEYTDDLVELELIFKFLSKESGAVGVLGRSLVIRTVSYRTLNKE